MKSARRILSLILTVAMLASCMVSVVFADDAAKTGTFSDVSADATYETAVKTLNLMGVINGYPDGTFGPDKNVTRAEFTAMLMRTLNYGSLGSTSAQALPFTDISDADTDISWAIPNIDTAHGMGVINGYPDGTFGPRNNVAYEEAVKMVVCALGYTDIDASVTPWYSNYLAQANKLGITQNAALLGSAEQPATRACIAQILYDSLEAKICRNGKPTEETILSSFLQYTKGIGVVSANGITGLTEPDSDLNPNEVQIYAQVGDTGIYETHTYKTADTSLKQYLGHQIEFYYKNDGSSRTLALYVLADNNEMTINAEDVDVSASDNTQIRYYKTADADSTTAVNLSPENVVIYNGKLYGNTAAQSRFATAMIPKIGSIRLLDSDTDGRYDLVDIQAYEIYFVSSKVSADKAFIDDVTRTIDKELVLDENSNSIKTNIVDKNGNIMSYSSIPNYSVIHLARSNANSGARIQTAVVVNDPVSGSVTGSRGGTSITINNNTYEYSRAASWMPGNSGTQAEPALRDSGTYYKDINGKIVAYRKDAMSENISYGYIMGIANADSVFDDQKTVRILSQNGSQVMLNINKDTRINGSTMESTDKIVSALQMAAAKQNNDAEATNVTIHQLIKYTTRVVDGATVLSDIYTGTETTNGQNITSDVLHYYTKVQADSSMQYTAVAKQLSGNGTSINIGSALVFVVPSNRSSYDEYAKSSLSTVFKDKKPYYVEVFDMTTTNTAKVVVCYGKSAEVVVDGHTPVSVVSAPIETSINEKNNQRMQFISGYRSSGANPKSTFEEWLSNSNENQYVPEMGDIFRAGADKEGFAKIENQHVIYKVAGGNTYGQFSSVEDNLYGSAYSVILGSVAAMDEESISIIPEYLGKGDTVADITSKSVNFPISSFSSARVLKYDTTGTELKINDVSSDYQGVIKSLTTYNDGISNPTKVLVYLSEGKICMLCVLGENVAK